MTARPTRLLAWCPLDTELSLVVVDGDTGTGASFASSIRPDVVLPTAHLALRNSLENSLENSDGNATERRGLAVVRSVDSLHLRDGVTVVALNSTTEWGAPEIAAARLEPDELLVDHLVGLDEANRVRVIGFLVEASLVGASDGDSVSQLLHRFREALRRRFPKAVVERDGRRGGVVEKFVKVDDHTSYLRGWLGWTPDQLRTVTAVSPEGERVEVGPMLHRHARTDVDAFYGLSPVARDGLGVATLLTTVGESRLDAGWCLEVETLDGSLVELQIPTAVSGLTEVRDALISELALDGDDDALCESHISPALDRLADRRTRSVTVADVVQHGRPPADPVATVLVPLYRRLDLMEYQLGQFSIDPAMADVDLIYVLDSPEQANELRAAAARWHRLYRLPFRLAVLTANGGFSLANNLGAELAVAPDLILCNSDVLPERPGWVADLLAARGRAVTALGSSRAVGAVGPMLLYEDDSLQHAGMYFDRAGESDPWSNEHYFKGLHRSFPPANRSRRVPALTAACVLVGLDRYRSVGGLSTSYVQGDYEDSDLCLRLAEEGAACWYASEVALYHLEGGSYPSPERTRFGAYNRWLHERRWGSSIESLMANGAFSPSAALDPPAASMVRTGAAS